MNGRMVMAMVYRQSTLQRFDRITVIDRGRVIDDGTAAELAWPNNLDHRRVPIARVPLKRIVRRWHSTSWSASSIPHSGHRGDFLEKHATLCQSTGGNTKNCQRSTQSQLSELIKKHDTVQSKIDDHAGCCYNNRCDDCLGI
jgi:hypothetical protein